MNGETIVLKPSLEWVLLIILGAVLALVAQYWSAVPLSFFTGWLIADRNPYGTHDTRRDKR